MVCAAITGVADYALTPTGAQCGPLANTGFEYEVQAIANAVLHLDPTVAFHATRTMRRIGHTYAAASCWGDLLEAYETFSPDIPEENFGNVNRAFKSAQLDALRAIGVANLPDELGVQFYEPTDDALLQIAVDAYEPGDCEYADQLNELLDYDCSYIRTVAAEALCRGSGDTGEYAAFKAALLAEMHQTYASGDTVFAICLNNAYFLRMADQAIETGLSRYTKFRKHVDAFRSQVLVALHEKLLKHPSLSMMAEDHARLKGHIRQQLIWLTKSEARRELQITQRTSELLPDSCLTSKYNDQEPSELAEEIAHMMSAIHRLPNNYAQVMQLCAAGYCRRDIGTILGVSYDTVVKRHQRATKNLRRQLSK